MRIENDNDIQLREVAKADREKRQTATGGPRTPQYDLTYISLGAGVQSTALLVMSNLGLQACPKADVAVFADTQCEPKWVYENLEFMEKWSAIPIVRVTAGHLGADLLASIQRKQKRAPSIPAWTTNAQGKAAPLWRQCTQDYKIRPIIKKVREILGYRRGQRVKSRVACLLGISAEEFNRMRFSRIRWITNAYPLVDRSMNRADCVKLLREHGIPLPRRSACVFCPYHSNAFWRELKDEYPDEWKRAVEFDHALRDMSSIGIKSSVYLHRERRPLEMVDLGVPAKDAPERFDEECQGLCGV